MRGYTGKTQFKFPSMRDVRPYVERAAACIVPLRIGAESRLKILEAFAMRKAVVSTRVGAEGLDVSAGEDILIADSPQNFATATLRVMLDGPLNRRLGEEGRRLAEQKYGWDHLADRLDGFLVDLTRRRRDVPVARRPLE
jgi:glycosyltransferase involved in cell wall biosynthesis